MKRVEMVDASILINVVGLPNEAEDRADVLRQLDDRNDQGISLVLPIAAIFETSQHIQRSPNGYFRRKCGEELDRLVRLTIAGQMPWTFFEVRWNDTLLQDLFDQQPPVIPNLVESLANQVHEAGDLLMLSEFRLLRGRLHAYSHDVDVWTLDRGLRAAVDHMRAEH